MTKAQILDTIVHCLNERKLCKLKFRYDAYYSYYFPLFLNDRLFLGAEEDDFELDGYSVRRIRDVSEADVRGDMCDQILIREGVVGRLTVPEIDLSGWETVFRSLDRIGKNVIVERESVFEDECEFIIGRIEKISKQFVYIRHFDADGVWEDEPYRMPYSEITSVTFGSRYVDVFSKYLGPLPDNFKKLGILQIDIVN